jgi:TolB-like protein/tetratricopeptide (TPR) repeat protein
MSPEQDQEYLSDGIAEEVLNLLVQIPELRVISRTSAFAFKGKDVSIPEIARQLNVAHILEGSVRKAGDRIRVTAQLIEARSDTHLWSQSWDRTLDDVFAIQDEIAAEMVGQLHLRLRGEIPRARRADPEAYLLYLEAHHLLSIYDYVPASRLLEKALQIDPDFADAWGDLSLAYTYQSPTYGKTDHTGDTYYLKHQEASRRMMELAPDDPRSMAWQAWNLMEGQGDLPGFARAIEQALARHPRHWNVIEIGAWLARVIGRSELAIPLLSSAVDRDPLCSRCSYQLARNLMRAGRFEAAEQEILRFRSLSGNELGRITLGLARLLQGDFNRVMSALSFDGQIVPEESDYETALHDYLELLVSLASNQADDPDSAIALFLQRYPDTTMLGMGVDAGLFAMAGNADRAFAALARSQAEFEPWKFADLLGEPLLAKLKDDPRWLEALEVAGIAPWQVAELNYQPPPH